MNLNFSVRDQIANIKIGLLVPEPEIPVIIANLRDVQSHKKNSIKN